MKQLFASPNMPAAGRLKKIESARTGENTSPKRQRGPRWRFGLVQEIRVRTYSRRALRVLQFGLRFLRAHFSAVPAADRLHRRDARDQPASSHRKAADHIG